MRLADLVPVTLLPAIPLVVLAVMPAQAPPVEEPIQVIDQPLEQRRMPPSPPRVKPAPPPPPVVCAPRKRGDMTGCEYKGTYWACLRVDTICESVPQPRPQIQT